MSGVVGDVSRCDIQTKEGRIALLERTSQAERVSLSDEGEVIHIQTLGGGAGTD